jgi:hypothetical protein
MASSPETIAASIQTAIAPGFRERLLARGQARSIIWQDGQLPADAPPFSPMLSHDLTSYGYALLVHGLRLLDMDGDREIARAAFEHSAEAIEAVFSKGESDPSRDFHRLVAASAYHLGRFSARAYSLLSEILDQANLSVSERSLALLMVRDLDELEKLVSEFCLGNSASDESLIELLNSISPSEQGDTDDAEPDPLTDVVELSLTDRFLRALAIALLAFERGDRQLVDRAIAALQIGLEGSSEFGLVQQWWCHRLAIHLLGELWEVSFHERLPKLSPDSAAVAWPELRELFIASLYCRARAAKPVSRNCASWPVSRPESAWFSSLPFVPFRHKPR